ncbi:hypothetical protein SSIN_1150 [Streptococcus sinensis]|uniref:Uncharacterized protein n=1 Tax=Streptococcus sinensis TaxID=176090 RepID=A0A0A0DGN6_9STRE|nr:hypothetical protein SSIN_1150 [Streptococcus sinensis]
MFLKNLLKKSDGVFVKADKYQDQIKMEKRLKFLIGKRKK